MTESERTADIFSPRAARYKKGIIARTPSLKRFLPKRVPFIPQTSSIDCGAACLAMVLASHRRHVPLQILQQELAVGRNGSNAAEIKSVAEQHGLDVRGLSLDADDLQKIATPAILHWNFTHFVVLERCARKGAYIVDPTTGRRFVSYERLVHSFTGVALEMTPRPTFAQSTPSRSDTQLQKMIRDLRGGVTGLFGLASLLQIVALAIPAATMIAVDHVIPNHRSAAIQWLYAVSAGYVTMYIVLAVVRLWLSVRLQLFFDQQLARAVVHRMLHLPLQFFQNRGTGDLLNRLTSITAIRDLLSQHLISVGIDGVVALIGLGVLLWVAPQLSGVAIAAALLQLSISVVIRNRLREALIEQIAATARGQSYLLEIVREIQSVKVAGAEANVYATFTEHYAVELAATQKRFQLEGLLEAFNTAVAGVVPLLLLTAGTRRVLDGNMSIGEMLACNAAAVGFLFPWSGFVNSLQRLFLIRRHIVRIDDVLERRPESSGRLPAPITINKGIEYRNVTFSYGSGAPAIQNVSFRIEPKEVVAIVGASGAGKSTVAKLLLGLYPATGILVEGVPLHEYRMSELRRSFGVVLQESGVFANTVRNNIGFNNPELPLERIVAAAKCACIHNDIEALPLGYETIISETGNNFSGGQRQRIGIARAVVHQPILLIFDEATSEIDGATEMAIYANVRKLEIPLLVIAHRLSTVRGADRILCMKDGTILESGGHDELMRRRGPYYSLFTASYKSGLSA